MKAIGLNLSLVGLHTKLSNLQLMLVVMVSLQSFQGLVDVVADKNQSRDEYQANSNPCQLE